MGETRVAKRKAKGPTPHKFRDKLVLNQWLISLFGIDPLKEHKQQGQTVRPFRLLTDPISDPRLEGLNHDNLHHFYHHLADCPLLSYSDPTAPVPRFRITRDVLLRYEENIVSHTQHINAKRHRPVVWKYYQWLTLLFVEIYLDRFFGNREGLLTDLNEYVARFNEHFPEYADVPAYGEDDLNKLCLQNATGSGKTLLMHVNLLQYAHYAKKHGKDKELSRTILLTPNERLSEQHIAEFRESNLPAANYLQSRGGLFGLAQGLERVDTLEITKLGDKEGPNTVATRSLGDQNLLLVDEGHRGMSGTEEGAWFTRRANLCAKGFTFEYSATFEQAVQASGKADFENSYAKAVLFDYSYRWFYEDGFGKDYQILNLPKTFKKTEETYLTACLLKFYQQLRIYEERSQGLVPFNMEKPLWVFVGSTVSSGKLGKDEKEVATDVAEIIHFFANFLAHPEESISCISELLTGTGQDTGLLDKDGNDIFANAFGFLAHEMNNGLTLEDLHRDILTRLFNSPAGGELSLERIKGDSGEIALRVGASEVPFGLINVGDAKSLCDHMEKLVKQNGTKLSLEDSDFTEAMFAAVKDSSSPVNLLIGSKKFVEGWDCWRVSTMGLMHVGRSEGAQIIQLFGRGVRLKGYNWSLKRSGHSHAPVRPAFIEELETLNVFGIEADFMEKFQKFLKDEGLPGNEHRTVISVPLNVTYDFGKQLKILRPKRKKADGVEYDFKKDAPIPHVGDIPAHLQQNPVIVDWYPRIQAIQSRSTAEAGQKQPIKGGLPSSILAMLDYDALFFDLEQFKRERSWYNLNVSKEGIYSLLKDPSWYTLYIPEARLTPTGYDGILLLQQVAAELLRRYCTHYYNYRKREFIEPRLELRPIEREDMNIPKDDIYQLIVDGDENQVIQGINKLKDELAAQKNDLPQAGDLFACVLANHLFQPLFHVRRGGKITILPVALNESEFQFVKDLKTWCDDNKAKLAEDGTEIFLLRNMSRGKGVGFFEAGNFHPDFIMWMLKGGKQYVTFIEPHGLLHEGPGSEKIQFHKRIKAVEARLNDPSVVLNSFILSCTAYPLLQWEKGKAALEDQHVLFMDDTKAGQDYLTKLFTRLKAYTAA
jgi:hypothetical protein